MRAIITLLAVSVGITTARANIAFQYAAPADPILSAALAIDSAAFTAHRYVGSTEVNHIDLLDPSGVQPRLSLSDLFFGQTHLGQGPALYNQGALQTGFHTAPISPAFFAVLQGGSVDLAFTLTDTADGLFAMDTMLLSLTTIAGTTQVVIENGVPAAYGNNGYGIGLPDGAPLPAPLPQSIPAGVDFDCPMDETISSASRVPEPGTLLGGLALLLGCTFRRR